MIFTENPIPICNTNIYKVPLSRSLKNWNINFLSNQRFLKHKITLDISLKASGPSLIFKDRLIQSGNEFLTAGLA